MELSAFEDTVVFNVLIGLTRTCCGSMIKGDQSGSVPLNGQSKQTIINFIPVISKALCYYSSLCLLLHIFLYKEKETAE